MEDEAEHRLQAALRSRRRSYERGLLLGRVAFAVLAVVTIQTGAGQHRSLLPVLTVTSVLLVAWNVGLAVAGWRGGFEGRRGSRLLWADGIVMTALITFEGGMATPWIPLSMGSLLLFGLCFGARRTALLAASFSAALLLGYALMRALPLDDRGTEVQDIPFGWFLNVFFYATAASVGTGVGWAFSRVAQATRGYERAMGERRNVERLRAQARRAGASAA